MATSVQVSGLHKSFPGVKALDDVSITVNEGEFFTLLGPSGCGKTTLLRTIAGFYRQDSGHIQVGGEIIDTVPPHRRDIGMVFQNYAVFPHMTVEQNVAFGLKNRKVSGDQIRKRVAKALETVRLTGYEQRTPDQLSGGQQQRVGLARAMVIEPRLLLLDEPLSNLDAKLRLHMREEILDIQRALGTTAVYVTHDQEEALVISDRIAVMNFGVVQQVGTPWEIYREPVNEFVAGFVGSMNALNGADALSMSASHKELVARLPAGRDPSAVKVCFRPEDVRLSRAEEDVRKSEVRYTGTVQKAMFLGGGVIYRIDTGKRQMLTVHAYIADRSELLAEEDRASVIVSLDKLLFFDSENGDRLREGV
ncbi:MAG: ABC transporter ATP-binding protein [Spirochaetaceae bacterium]|nr:MAG: ABC transporter ATP-binding protein [Spirochaetaceae bacterium]